VAIHTVGVNLLIKAGISYGERGTQAYNRGLAALTAPDQELKVF